MRAQSLSSSLQFCGCLDDELVTDEGLGRVLAHVTESRMRALLDELALGRFLFVLDEISRAARESTGFVWQLQSHGRGHPVLSPDDELGVVSLSTWVDYIALHSFVYRSAHVQALLHRQEWFQPVTQPSTALWWAPAAQPPTLAQAVARLAYLRRHGPSPQAFTLTRRFTANGQAEGRAVAHRGSDRRGR